MTSTDFGQPAHGRHAPHRHRVNMFRFRALAVILVLAAFPLVGLGIDGIHSAVNARADHSWTAVPAGVPAAQSASTVRLASLTIGIVGDSIANSCTDGDHGMCGALSALLAPRGISATYATATQAGASCGPLAALESAMLAAAHPDVVVIMCGTNNDARTAAGRASLATQWRTLVEQAHAAGAVVLPAWIQYSEPKINAWQGRQWLIDSEPYVNDVIYQQWLTYKDLAPSWFAGLLDLQGVPATRTYLADRVQLPDGSIFWDGIHPNHIGQQVYAALLYRALHAWAGWPDTVVEPCGLYGARPDPAYQQYVSYVSCGYPSTAGTAPATRKAER